MPRRKARRVDPDDIWRSGKKLPAGARLINADGTSLAVRYVDRGVVHNWNTVEICTKDMEEVKRYVRTLPPMARVWISAKGTLYVITPPKPPWKDRRGKWHYPKPRKDRMVKGEGHAYILNNTRAGWVVSGEHDQAIREGMNTFNNPVTGEDDIEFFCVRHKR